MTVAYGLLASWGEAARPGEAVESPQVGGVLSTVPREAQQRLSRARQAILETRYGDAIADLRLLLDEGAEDGFLASVNGAATQTTVRREAGRLIDALSPKAAGRTRCAMAATPRPSWSRQFAGETARHWPASAGRICSIPKPAIRRRCCWPRTTSITAVPWRRWAGWRRLDESAGAAEECEPLCGLLTARCWLAAGQPDRAREALDHIKRAPEREVPHRRAVVRRIERHGGGPPPSGPAGGRPARTIGRAGRAMDHVPRQSRPQRGQLVGRRPGRRPMGPQDGRAFQ